MKMAGYRQLWCSSFSAHTSSNNQNEITVVSNEVMSGSDESLGGSGGDGEGGTSGGDSGDGVGGGGSSG